MNLGEADRIVTFLTPDHGKLKAIAKGSRRIKSKLGGHLELFNRVDLVLAQGRNLDIVTGARLVSHQPRLSEDMGRLGLGFLLSEMVNKLVDEGQETQQLFGLADELLGDLNDHQADALGELYLKLRFLDALGYRPVLDRCVNCNKELVAKGRHWLDPALGGVVDESCESAGSIPIDESQIKLWRLALTQPLLAVRQIIGAMVSARRGLPLADSFYEHVFGRRFGVPVFAEASGE